MSARRLRSRWQADSAHALNKLTKTCIFTHRTHAVFDLDLHHSQGCLVGQWIPSSCAAKRASKGSNCWQTADNRQIRPMMKRNTWLNHTCSRFASSSIKNVAHQWRVKVMVWLSRARPKAFCLKCGKSSKAGLYTPQPPRQFFSPGNLAKIQPQIQPSLHWIVRPIPDPNQTQSRRPEHVVLRIRFTIAKGLQLSRWYLPDKPSHQPQLPPFVIISGECTNFSFAQCSKKAMVSLLRTTIEVFSTVILWRKTGDTVSHLTAHLNCVCFGTRLSVRSTPAKPSVRQKIVHKRFACKAEE